MNYIRLIAWKEFVQIRSDPLIIRLMILPILAQMFILGYAITTEVKNVTVTVVDRSRTPQSVSLVQAVVRNPLFRFAGYSESEAGARACIDDGKARIALLIPPDFALELQRPAGASVGMIVDGQDANSSNVASGYVNSIIGQWSIDFLRRKYASMGIRLENAIPADVRPVILFNPLLKSTWYMIPGLAVVVVTMITALLTSLSLVRERETGTFEQLMVSPIAPLHVVLGKIVPYVVIGLIELFGVLIMAVLWFRVPFHGNVFILALFGLVYMSSSLGVGILVSTVARNPQQVLFMLWFTLIFFLFLSGFFLPLENMPHWVQKVTYVNPLRYFMFIQREMFLKGSGIAELWKQGLGMLAIGVVMFGGALAAFNRKVG